MNDLIVCTYCDRPQGLLGEYQTQLEQAGIDLHVEHIDPFPHPSGLPISFKLHWMREFATRFHHYRQLVFTDAYDVLFAGTKQQAMESLPWLFPVWAAERNCYPEPQLASRFTGTTPWRYVNAGMMGGPPQAILNWVDAAERHRSYELAPLDQCWLNRRCADTPALVPLDDSTSVFYVVSSTLERGELQIKDGRPWNSATNTFPCFFHFSGGCPTEGFRNLLSGNVDRLQ